LGWFEHCLAGGLASPRHHRFSHCNFAGWPHTIISMSPPGSNDRRRIIAGVCLILGPALVLVADLLGTHRLTFLTLMSAAFILLLPGAFGVAHLLRARADWFGLLGAGCCLIGLTASFGVMSVYRFATVYQSGVEGVSPNALQLALQTEPRLFVLTFLPAYLWPVGLLILSVGLILDRRFGVAVGSILALGAILFPIGREASVTMAVLPGDLLIFAALAWIGVRLLREPSAWEG
jgi:hypothetical protein